jgi:hypothetical protein
MPSVKQSQGANMTGWQPAPAPDLQTVDNKGEPPAPNTYPNRSPFMLSSMPLMASTNDALNQFYGLVSLPFFRTVPIQHGGAS